MSLTLENKLEIKQKADALREQIQELIRKGEYVAHQTIQVVSLHSWNPDESLPLKAERGNACITVCFEDTSFVFDFLKKHNIIPVVSGKMDCGNAIDGYCFVLNL